ncbi:TPA: transposase [Neisseria subflava]
MSTFFRQTAQAMIVKHIDRFPLLKLDQVIDWQPFEQYLNRQRTRYLRDHRGRPAYPLLSMFKAVLPGQWHSLSDPELEQSFGTLHRKFRYARAACFGLIKVSAQSHLKAMCLNLLKAANRPSTPVAA